MFQRTRRHVYERSYLNVDWGSPVNWAHRLNDGLLAWLIAAPHRSFTNTFWNLVHKGQNFTGVNTENTDWSPPLGGARLGGWSCVDLGGTNEYFQYSASLFTAYPFTMTGWIRPANITGTHGAVCCGNSGNGTDYMTIACDGAVGGDPVRMETGAPTDFDTAPPSTSTAFVAGEWNHVAGVWAAGDDRRVYHNAGGKGTSTDTVTGTPNLNTTTIGALNNTGGPYSVAVGQIDCVRIYNRILTDDEILEEYELTRDYSAGLLNRRMRVTWFVSSAVTAAVTGTATASITEADVVAGGKTIIITLTGDTWVASGATFDAQRQAIIDGLDSAQAEATGWNAEVRDNEVVAAVVRTSDTVVTITLSAAAAYDITAQETITATVPAAALTGGNAVVATPTFTVATAGGDLLLRMMGQGLYAGSAA